MPCTKETKYVSICVFTGSRFQQKIMPFQLKISNVKISTSYLNHDTLKRNPRISHRRCSIRNDVLRNFTKYTRKHLCQSFFFDKVAGLSPATLLKKRLRHRCFPVNFANFQRAPFSRNTSGQLFLKSLSERISK